MVYLLSKEKKNADVVVSAVSSSSSAGGASSSSVPVPGDTNKKDVIITITSNLFNYLNFQ